MPNQNPVLLALSYYGETPLAGNANDPAIQQMLVDAGLPPGSPDETPWCSAFLIWLFQRCCVLTPADATALSWLKYSTDTKTPALGDIVVLQWFTDGVQHAHVGFFIREVLGGVYVLAGNQNNEVDIALWKKADVLSYRRYAGP